MRNQEKGQLIFHFKDFLPKNENNSVYKAINTFSSDITAKCEKELRKKNPALLDTVAYLAFDKSLIEFINNSDDAKATKIEINIYVNEVTQKITIEIRDNGEKKNSRGKEFLPDDKIGPYDWMRALEEASVKQIEKVDATSDIFSDAEKNKKSCSQHLALSTTAAGMEKHKGLLSVTRNEKPLTVPRTVGLLTFIQNKPAQGAVVSLTSSLNKCTGFLEDRDKALVTMLQTSAEKKAPNDTEKQKEFLNNIKKTKDSRSVKDACMKAINLLQADEAAASIKEAEREAANIVLAPPPLKRKPSITTGSLPYNASSTPLTATTQPHTVAC
ncbi:MAG: hypothetical protein NTU49_06090, partial [Gammaproteobacteria bacterium]|nr:hypothetical protein [Gammaproteobacteria bacterium]